MNAERNDTMPPMGASLLLKDRRMLEIHGVTDVVRFDEDSAEFATVCGSMTVEGNGLHVLVLNLEQGIVSLDGRVDSILYDDPETAEKSPKGGLFGRLFR